MEMHETNGALCLAQALQDSEYGYFKSSILSAWAGPQHWKVKTSVKGINAIIALDWFDSSTVTLSCV